MIYYFIAYRTLYRVNFVTSLTARWHKERNAKLERFANFRDRWVKIHLDSPANLKSKIITDYTLLTDSESVVLALLEGTELDHEIIRLINLYSGPKTKFGEEYYE